MIVYISTKQGFKQRQTLACVAPLQYTPETQILKRNYFPD